MFNGMTYEEVYIEYIRPQKVQAFDEGYEQGRADAERDFQNSDYWNDYLAKVIKDAKEDAIDEFANWLPKHFDLRFSNNPKVWIDEYFNHTSEKILEQLKEQNDG